MEGTRCETPRRCAGLGSCSDLDFGHRADPFYFFHDRRRGVDAAVAPALGRQRPLDYSRLILVVRLGRFFRRRLLGPWLLRRRRLVRRRRLLGELGGGPCWFWRATRGGWGRQAR